MTDRPWMPLDIEDYLADTPHLSAAEHGAYMLLIMRYWKDGGLPDDEKLIQRYSRLTQEQWKDSRDVIAAFFTDGWRHRRIDAELEKAAGIIEKRRAAAKIKHSRPRPSAQAEQVQSISTDTGVPPVTDNLPSSLRSDGRARERRPNPIVILQSEVNAMSAQRWVRHCEDKRKPVSVPQAEQQAQTLKEIKAAGGNADDAIQFAIGKGWTSLSVEYFRNNGFQLRAAPVEATEDWAERMRYFRSDGTWGAWGPKPGERGCRVPEQFLTETRAA